MLLDCWPGIVGWHDVDERVAGSKLCQFALPHFQAQAEHIEVDPFQCRRVGRAQHDVIDPRVPSWQAPFLAPNRSYSRTLQPLGVILIGGSIRDRRC